MSGQERIESIRSIRELLIGGSDRVTTGKLIRFCWKCNFIISRIKIGNNKNSINCFGSLREGLKGGLDDSRIIAVCLSTSRAFISFADQYWDIFTSTSVVFCHHPQDRLPLPCNRQSSAIPPGLDGFCDVV